MFLIETTRNNEAGAQGEPTIGKTKGHIFLDQKSVKGKFADESIVLNGKPNDDQHIEPKHEQNDKGVFCFHHDCADKVGYYNGMAKAYDGIAHIFSFKNFISIIKVVKNN